MSFAKNLAYTPVAFVFLIAITPLVLLAQPTAPDDGPTSAGTSFQPNILPSLQIAPITGDIRIDGEIDEVFWADAARAVNFSENFPDDLAEPPIGIEVLVTYDTDNLYLAYLIEDDPSEIRSNFSDRDAIFSDDYVGMILDTNGDGQQTYFIAANPKGIQGDTFMSANGEDVSFNMIYESAGKVTASGYQVEMAIPFRSLRFPESDVQTWRATFWITHPRDSRNQYSWAGINRDDPCFSCQLGFLEGMRGIRAGKNLEILPTITGSQSGALADFKQPKGFFDNDRLSAEPSLNVKYGITSDLTADLTLNPDFSQIESDAAQIDVNSTFALFFPERRTFFQEGSDLFQTSLQTVYTRSINDPIVANKLTGRFGNLSLGYIGARDNQSPVLLPFEESSRLISGGKSFSNILRARQSFSNSSFIGALVTDRRLDAGGSGSTFGMDGSLRFLTNYTFSFQAVASRTIEGTNEEMSAGLGDLTFDNGSYTAAFDGESFWGHALYGSIRRGARHWNFDVSYREFSPTFRADNGFINQNAVRRIFSFQNVTFYPKSSFIDRISPRIMGMKSWNFDGLSKSDWFAPGLNLQLKRQTNVNLQMRFSREIFAEKEFKGIRSFFGNVRSNFSEQIQLGFNVNWGQSIARNVADPFLGNSRSFGANATLRPTQRFVIRPQIDYSDLKNPDTGDDVFSGYILRSRFNYQFTGKLLARLIIQYNDFAESLEIDPLVTYRVNSFTVFHVGSTHRYDTFSGQNPGDPSIFAQSSRQIFFKAQYLFRR
ncbi:MAG: hypothetical protein BMS9Abin05_0198 [Rhodothermia bacterium]|nr:MAG: hypothetical protein BMS9Abin05_0198 [Rhodothermia bacterium]